MAQDMQESQQDEQQDANRALVRRFIEDFWTSGDLRRVGEFLASGYVEHNLLPDQAPGLEGYKRRFVALREAFPDVRVTIDDLLAEGDRVVARMTIEGTQRRPFLGRAPSGRTVRMTAINIYRIANGLIVERWGVQDLYGLLRQIDGDEQR